MKTTMAVVFTLSTICAAPAHAQLGGLSGRQKQAQDAKAKGEQVFAAQFAEFLA